MEKKMSFKALFPKVLFLTVVLALLFWIPIPGVREFGGFHTFPYFLLIAFLDTLVLTYLIFHSQWRSWKLVISVFILFYGVMTFMSQIETVVFLNFLQDIVTKEEIPRLFLAGILIAGVYSPLAVFLYEKTKKKGQEEPPKSPYSPMRLFWKFLLVGVVYMFVYLIFGALVFKPLAGEAFNQYYGSTEFPAWMLPFQVLRGILWGLFFTGTRSRIYQEI